MFNLVESGKAKRPVLRSNLHALIYTSECNSMRTQTEYYKSNVFQWYAGMLPKVFQILRGERPDQSRNHYMGHSKRRPLRRAIAYQLCCIGTYASSSLCEWWRPKTLARMAALMTTICRRHPRAQRNLSMSAGGHSFELRVRHIHISACIPAQPCIYCERRLSSVTCKSCGCIRLLHSSRSTPTAVEATFRRVVRATLTV